MRRNKVGFIYAVILALMINGCNTHLKPGQIQPHQTYIKKMDLRTDGYRRSYRVHVPRGYHPNRAWPLVVVIHGAFSNAKEFEKVTGFSQLGDREGFIVLYPNGIGIFGFLQHWNAGHCCGKAADDNIDDVGFVMAAIEDVALSLNIDRTRLYVVGFSNGGMLTHRIGAEQGLAFAAIAPVAGALGGKPSDEASQWRIPEPQAPLPVLLMHGTADDKVPYDGGLPHGKKSGRRYLSVSDAAQFWTTHNGCSSSLKTQQTYDGQVVITTWADCTQPAVVVQLIQLIGVDHHWLGKQYTARLADQHPLKTYDAADAIWHFLKKYRRQSGDLTITSEW